MDSPVRPRKIPWHLILIFSLLSLGILGTGYFFYDYQLSSLKQEKLNELKTIADLKITQNVEWRYERLADATVIKEDPFLAARVNDLLKGNANSELKTEIIHRLKALLVYHYQNIILIDPQGRVRLSVLGEEQSLGAYTKPLALEAMQTRKTLFSDFYRPKGSQAVRLSILVPIILSQGIEEVSVGAILNTG